MRVCASSMARVSHGWPLTLSLLAWLLWVPAVQADGRKAGSRDGSRCGSSGNLPGGGPGCYAERSGANETVGSGGRDPKITVAEFPDTEGDPTRGSEWPWIQLRAVFCERRPAASPVKGSSLRLR